MAKKPEDGDGAVEKKSKSNMVLIIVVVLLVVLLIGGGAAAFFLLGNNDDEVAASIPSSQDAKVEKKKSSSKKSTDHLTIGPMYPMAQFVVNLLSESGNRFLKVAVDLELSDAKLQPEMDHKKSLIRDIIIRTFSSKTFEEISTLKGKDKLKEEVLDKINENLSDGQVKNIYFTDFVVQ
ncbi:flagellar basal body-associated protein FliL [Sulfurospirillum halorespirans]|uniref:Flagellar protein FliL n=1 Tax=Sulfurospirillum halorespirans DSM 13726 TaxID=1193502 RepID=A0A1D7TIV4_9BACT|nr:flagellar basal body-associated protein FliL [Sulfurospirillum halorespirans]AOO64921.1 flagellar biosynthesis protein FliL [Sulfurospirillum halorespirans DSM 13726]